MEYVLNGGDLGVIPLTNHIMLSLKNKNTKFQRPDADK